jgi:Xaa-Pro aminopeptidase
MRAKTAYQRAGVDWVAVYADREHFANMAFLSGFEPRFEEAFLLLGGEGRRILVVGNESRGYVGNARLPGLDIRLGQSLSLMGQDRTKEPRLADTLADLGIKRGDSVGLIGWKYLDPEEDEDFANAFYVPAAYVEMFKRRVGSSGEIRDATRVLMHPEVGLRATIDADQIAAFEWAAVRCSRSLWKILSGVREGESEYEAVRRMEYEGDPLNVHTMFASSPTGEPVVGLRSPTSRRLERGDSVTSAIGYWGALSCRAGLVSQGNDEFLVAARAYFAALATWYDVADIGTTGGEVHAAVVDRLAEGRLNAALNPGHLTGHEEWMHSPIRPKSQEKLRSGMPFQVDIIPTKVPRNWALNCEDPVVLADQSLRDALKGKHADCFARVEMRRKFMRDALGVEIRPNILPLSATPLCLPPFWLEASQILVRD